MLNKDLTSILNKLNKGLESLDVEIVIYDETAYIHLFSRDEFEDGQLGYRIDPDGNSLLGDNEGDWKESWYVIVYDEELGDPIFVDINNKNYPVMTAMPGQGDWEPELIFSTLDDFIDSFGKTPNITDIEI